jgi:biopolymer transport protein ExbD
MADAPIVFGTRKKIADPEMDMTPMVDVTFLLLIFFMVTAAFTMQRSFEVPTPNRDQPSSQVRTLDDFEEDPDFVIVRVDEFNTFHVLASSWDEERECPGEQDLLVNLREASRGAAGNNANKLLVMAHGDATHEKVVMAMDAGTAVGMEDVKLVTVEDDSL